MDAENQDVNHSLIPSFITGQLEKLANKALEYAPGTRLELLPHAGKTIKFTTTAPRFCIYLSVEENHLTFSNFRDSDADTAIEGPAMALMAQLTRSDNSIIGTRIKISGDQALARELLTILKNLDVDWEEPLSLILGDVAAHHLGRFTRKTLGWIQGATRNLMTDARDFLVEEQKLLVERPRIEHFYQQVDKLREDYDRAEARYQLLLTRLKTTERIN